jgi:hypothetical protein
MSNFRYQVLEHRHSGLQAIKLTEGAYEGIIYTYGKVNLEPNEENDTLHLKFEYEILENADRGMTDMKPFENYIGDILEELLHQGVEENNLTYTGGTEIDANRTKDSEQSDI